MLYTVIVEVEGVVAIEQAEAPTPAAAIERWSRWSAVRPARASAVEPTTVTGFPEVWCADTFDEGNRYVLLHIVETDGRRGSDRWVVVWNVHGGTFVTKAHAATAPQALERSAEELVKNGGFSSDVSKALCEASLSATEPEVVFSTVWRWRHGPFDAIIIPVAYQTSGGDGRAEG